MLRFIITALFVTLFLIYSIPLFFIEWIIGKFNMDIKNRSSLAIVNWAFGVVLLISGVKITVIGEENVPKDQAATLDEYRKYIEKDQALERRFQPVRVEEPSVSDTLAVMNGTTRCSAPLPARWTGTIGTSSSTGRKSGFTVKATHH